MYIPTPHNFLHRRENEVTGYDAYECNVIGSEPDTNSLYEGFRCSVLHSGKGRERHTRYMLAAGEGPGEGAAPLAQLSPPGEKPREREIVCN